MVNPLSAPYCYILTNLYPFASDFCIVWFFSRWRRLGKYFSFGLFFYVNCSHIIPYIHFAGMTVWPWYRFCNAAVG
ncbi:hypothetical protein GSC36_004308 [Salmonella enterica]|nr:hypothetical protein [Salmonella enterica]